MKRFLVLISLYFLQCTSGFSQPYYNVKDYGAKGDGKTLCTASFQKAVDACAKAGGGRIIFPAGKYLTGPIFLKSNIHIEIESGAVLLFDNRISQTAVIDGSWEGIKRKVYASLFTG